MDTFVYNGLGLRVGKTDSTGSYSYMCDGASPGSAVLNDGHATYTPGLSENRNGTAAYYSNDRLGNLWTLDGTTKNQLTYADFSGFGSPVSGGLGGTPFGFGGGNGCQTDSDIGLVLMGHRYYDTRIGRFISQDPAGDGDNWYAYCDNDPINNVDPMGLQLEGSSPMGSPGYLGINSGAQANADMGFLEDYSEKTYTHTWQEVFKFSADPGGGGSYKDTGNEVPGSDTWTEQGGIPMFAQSSVTTPQGAAEVGQLGEDGVTVGKPGNPFKSIEDAVQKAREWLGDFGKHVENKDGDHVFMNKAGTRKLRFDIKNPSPHQSPHGHMEELINGKWKGVGQIYPKGVPPR